MQNTIIHHHIMPLLHIGWARRRLEIRPRLINNPWEMVAQPSCLQPQPPTTTGMLNTHTILHIQPTLYEHNDSDMQELIFHHSGGILLVQKCWHKLARSSLGVDQTMKCCMCGAPESGKASTVIPPQRLRFRKLMWPCEHLYGRSSGVEGPLFIWLQ